MMDSTRTIYDKGKTKVKRQVYKRIVRRATLFGLETVALNKRHEAELEVAELTMLRVSLGETEIDGIRLEHMEGEHRSDV